MIRLYSKEILNVNETYVALSTVTSVSDIYLFGIEGYGAVYHVFTIQSAFGENNGTRIYGEEVDYSGYICTGEDEKEYVEKAYAKCKKSLEIIRQQVLSYWNQYLEEKKNETTL